MTKTSIALSLLAALAAAPAGAQVIAPGEETVFAVTYLSVPAGEARIRVGSPEGDILPVILQARTSGAASLLDIREHMVSYWDAQRRRSRGSDLQAYEVGDYHVDTHRFDADTGTVTVTEQRRGRKAKRTVLEVPAGALDLSGALLWLRLQDLEVGGHFEIPVVAGTTQFTLVADVKDEEVVETPAGSFPSVRVLIRTAFEGKFSTRRDTLLWLSRSADHHLVRASAEFAVGSVVCELKSYRPGTQLAAAD